MKQCNKNMNKSYNEYILTYRYLNEHKYVYILAVKDRPCGCL